MAVISPTGAHRPLQATAATLAGSGSPAAPPSSAPAGFSHLLSSKIQDLGAANSSTPPAAQGITQLNQNLTSLLAMQSLSQGVNLIGKTVAYTNSAGKTASGTVSSVTMVGGQLKVVINNTNVGLNQIQSVQDAANKTGAAATVNSTQSLGKGSPTPAASASTGKHSHWWSKSAAA